jgi:hypothetical protein
MAICVALGAIAGCVYLLFVRFKKFGVIIPWATGLSGHLKNAFVTGSILSFFYFINLV